MPIYEYRCQACGHELETLQFLNEEPLTDCPDCGKPELKRKISASGFRLKGGGWYETDFKKDKRRNVAGEGEGKSAEKGESGKSSDKKSDGADKKPDKVNKDKADKPKSSSESPKKAASGD